MKRRHRKRLWEELSAIRGHLGALRESLKEAKKPPVPPPLTLQEGDDIARFTGKLAVRHAEVERKLAELEKRVRGLEILGTPFGPGSGEPGSDS